MPYPNPVGYFTTSSHADRLCDQFGDRLESLPEHDKAALIAGLSCLQLLRRMEICELDDVLSELLEEEEMTPALEDCCQILDGIPTGQIRGLLQFLLQ